MKNPLVIHIKFTLNFRASERNDWDIGPRGRNHGPPKHFSSSVFYMSKNMERLKKFAHPCGPLKILKREPLFLLPQRPWLVLIKIKKYLHD